MNSSKPSLAKKLIKIGCVTEARSLQGEVRFHLFTGEASWAPKLKFLFLQAPSNAKSNTRSLERPSASAVSDPDRVVSGAAASSPEAGRNIGQPQNLVEYKVSSFREQSGRIILKLQGVNTRDEAEALRGYVGWIPESFLQSKKGEAIFLREVLHFSVYDGEKLLGPVTAFESNGPQDLLVVDLGETKTTLIPFIKEFLVKIDYDAKTIYMALPEGLVDLYNEAKCP